MDMRKFFSVLAAGLFFSLSLFADPPAKKTAVVYFSMTDTTAKIAKDTASEMGAPVFQVLSEHEYTHSDLNQRDKNALSVIEASDKDARPALKYPVDISDYDHVILFYPIWRGYAPKVLYTFMESQKWKGKKLVTICTSGGSGLGRSGNELAKLAPGVDYRGGKDCSRSSGAEISKFVQRLLK